MLKEKSIKFKSNKLENVIKIYDDEENRVKKLKDREKKLLKSTKKNKKKKTQQKKIEIREIKPRVTFKRVLTNFNEEWSNVPFNNVPALMQIKVKFIKLYKKDTKLHKRGTVLKTKIVSGRSNKMSLVINRVLSRRNIGIAFNIAFSRCMGQINFSPDLAKIEKVIFIQWRQREIK